MENACFVGLKDQNEEREREHVLFKYTPDNWHKCIETWVLWF